MKNGKLTKATMAVVAIAVLGGPALGQEWTPDRDHVLEQPEPYSPYVDQHYPNRVYWGDTHHHTILSFDRRADRYVGSWPGHGRY